MLDKPDCHDWLNGGEFLHITVSNEIWLTGAPVNSERKWSTYKYVEGKKEEILVIIWNEIDTTTNNFLTFLLKVLLYPISLLSTQKLWTNLIYMISVNGYLSKQGNWISYGSVRWNQL